MEDKIRVLISEEVRLLPISVKTMRGSRCI